MKKDKNVENSEITLDKFAEMVMNQFNVQNKLIQNSLSELQEMKEMQKTTDLEISFINRSVSLMQKQLNIVESQTKSNTGFAKKIDFMNSRISKLELIKIKII